MEPLLCRRQGPGEPEPKRYGDRHGISFIDSLKDICVLVTCGLFIYIYINVLTITFLHFQYERSSSDRRCGIGHSGELLKTRRDRLET